MQWHQLGHMQVCTSLQTDNHVSTPPQVFTGRMPFLPPNQQHQSTEGKNVKNVENAARENAKGVVTSVLSWSAESRRRGGGSVDRQSRADAEDVAAAVETVAVAPDGFLSWTRRCEQRLA